MSNHCGENDKIRSEKKEVEKKTIFEEDLRVMTSVVHGIFDTLNRKS